MVYLRRSEMEALVKLALRVAEKAKLAQDRGDSIGLGDLEVAVSNLSKEVLTCRVNLCARAVEQQEETQS